MAVASTAAIRRKALEVSLRGRPGNQCYVQRFRRGPLRRNVFAAVHSGETDHRSRLVGLLDAGDLIVGQLELDGGQSVVEVGLLGDADDRSEEHTSDSSH